jgi:alkylhydroperoxidase family enzyme
MTPTTIAPRLDFEALAPHANRALAHLDHAVTKELDAVDFDARLRELVRIRASQLNGRRDRAAAPRARRLA